MELGTLHRCYTVSMNCEVDIYDKSGMVVYWI